MIYNVLKSSYFCHFCWVCPLGKCWNKSYVTGFCDLEYAWHALSRIIITQVHYSIPAIFWNLKTTSTQKGRLTSLRGNPDIGNFMTELDKIFSRNKNIWNLIKMSFRQCKFSHGLEKVLKMPTICQEKCIFHIPRWFIFIFPVKKAVLNWFSYIPFRTYIYTTISIKKLFIKWFNNTVKTKLQILICHW